MYLQTVPLQGRMYWLLLIHWHRGITSICDYDIIICGKQTTDGDTAQVGPAMAEYLGIPCAAWVGEIADVDDASVTVGQDLSMSDSWQK